MILGTKRAVPDVCANADPNTGYYLIYQGNPIYVGGTSAVAPLLAGLVCRINQLRASNTGLLQTSLYSANPSVCRDITVGNNGAFSATVGFDNCSGLGVIDGQKLLSLFPTGPSGPTPVPPPPTVLSPVANFTTNIALGQVTFTDTSTNIPTSWLWSFGDNTANSNVQNPVHTFQNSGTYTVSLTSSNTGGSNTITKQVAVQTISSLPLQAAFHADITNGKVPLTVNFIDTSAGSPIRWTWTVSDGNKHHFL